jgi:uncharacterized membrane protein
MRGPAEVIDSDLVLLSRKLGPDGPAGIRVATAGAVGVAAAVWTGTHTRLPYAPPVGWITAATIYLVWTWGLVWRMDASATRDHARNHEKDGSSTPAHILVTTSALASLAGVGYLLYATSASRSDLLAGAVGVLSVALSWFAVHTVYALRYAQLYYSATDLEKPGIDFNGTRPAYPDFAYLAFTVGMSYAVSDTNLTNRRMRTTVLSQAMVSYLLGAVIIAITLNVVTGLAN